MLTLENFTHNEKDKKQSKSITKRESFYRELNRIRNEVTTYVDDIQRQIIAIRPHNTHDPNYIDQLQSYFVFVHLTTDLLTKLDQLFTEIFDRFRLYMDELWNYMNNHDDGQVRRVTRQFNNFLFEKTSNSDQLFNHIQKCMDDIEDTQWN